MIENFCVLLKRYYRGSSGVSALEAALMFPVLLTLLLGVYEIGSGIIHNQKAIRAAQVTADLLSRERSINDADITQAMEAARQAILPLNDAELGVDVVSVEYGADSEGNEIITTLWRETRNMPQDAQVLTQLSGLGSAGEGALAVVVSYKYSPLFSHFAFDEINMREVAFFRPRKSSIVTKQ